MRGATTSISASPSCRRPGSASVELFPGQERDDPSLRVVGEDDSGVIVSGMKMLATGGVYADEVWIGNLTPIEDKYQAPRASPARVPLRDRACRCGRASPMPAMPRTRPTIR